MSHVLRLYEDYLFAGQAVAFGGLPRALYVASGAVAVDGDTVTADNGLVGLGARDLTAGPEGTTLWRWEVTVPGATQTLRAGRGGLKLEAGIDLAAIGESHLLRLDSVAFPPGGCAFLHTHQGPGIRCLIEGRIRIDTDGKSTSYGPGAPWFEAGPEPVFAQADAAVPTRFIRAMVLPGSLLGASSIRYVREADKAKPKSQSYRVFGETVFH